MISILIHINLSTLKKVFFLKVINVEHIVKSILHTGNYYVHLQAVDHETIVIYNTQETFPSKSEVNASEFLEKTENVVFLRYYIHFNGYNIFKSSQ